MRKSIILSICLMICLMGCNFQSKPPIVDWGEVVHNLLDDCFAGDVAPGELLSVVKEVGFGVHPRYDSTSIESLTEMIENQLESIQAAEIGMSELNMCLFEKFSQGEMNKEELYFFYFSLKLNLLGY